MNLYLSEIEGVAWTFSDPEAEWVAWQNRIAAYENETEAKIRLLDQELSQAAPKSLTKKRLGALRTGTIQQRETVRSLLRAFYPIDQRVFDLSLALRSRIPQKQGLLNYASNILRDWGPWSNLENQIYLDLIRPLLGDREFKRAYIPGCGAGRFAYDLHQSFRIQETIALDQNPLLVCLGRKVSNGSDLTWAEFPMNPASHDSACVIETCRAPAPSRAGLHFVLGDALVTPSEPRSFNLVVTPWLIDVIPETFDAFARRMNAHLDDHGEWINFGPLAFSFKNPRFQFSFDEIKEILTQSGFEILSSGENQNTPYLKSPHLGGSRLETLFWFHAKKTHSLDFPASHSRMPPWIENSDLAIPALPEFAQTGQNSAVFAEVCSQINGTRSIHDLSAFLTQKFGLPTPAAVLALKKFLSDLIEKP